MADNDSTKIAKEAFILSEQLKELEAAMMNAGQIYTGYRAFAESFNQILNRAKEILKYDAEMLRSINHLRSYNPAKDTRYAKDFLEIKADIAVLKATLRSFFVFYLPADEKKRIGFSS